MDKAPSSAVDSHMRNLGAADPEKDEISGYQTVQRDASRCTELVAAPSGDVNAGLLMAVPGQPAAIKPASGRDASITIAYPQLLAGILQDHLRSGRDRWTNDLWSKFPWRRGRNWSTTSRQNTDKRCKKKDLDSNHERIVMFF